jgi:putative hydrolase
MSRDPAERPEDDEGGEGQGQGPTDPMAAMFQQMFGGAGGAGSFGGIDPAMLGAAGLPADPQALSQVLAQVQRLLSTAGEGPVNWELARDVARQAAVAGGDPSVGESQRRDVLDALRLAELWLDGITDMPAAGARAQAWSRSEWVERTLPTWRRLSEPVATSVADAMAAAMAQQAPEELRPMVAAAGQMVRQVGGAVFGMQVGQAVGALATEVVASTDVGLPLTDDGTTALLPSNVAAFGEGLGVPAEEVRLYLALREAAHARLFASSPWLRAHLLGAVEAYARGITIDTQRIEEAVSQVDPTDPQALQQALSNGLFEPQRTPQQQAALDRLETALALVEGWVDEVVDEAARGPLPSAAALREAVRRRRAAGGPAEHTLASLVGLELRPRRLRDAATLWGTLAEARGRSGRDAVWQHPDLLPTAADLDDPAGFAERRGDADRAAADVDAALERLLRGDGPAEGTGEGTGRGPETPR